MRPCRIEDLNAVLRIEQVSFAHPYDRYIFAHYLTRGPQGFLVAEDHGRILGYILFTVERDHGLIISLAVDPPHRRKGVATTLLDAAFTRLASSVTSVQLQVAIDNAPALAFYRRHGFTTLTTIPHYYPDGKDALLMAKPLLRPSSGS